MATVRGYVRRLTYRNETNGYTVAKIEVDEASPLSQEVTVVGHFPRLALGEWVELQGEWQRHPEFGMQFRATEIRNVPPATAKGIERYLASGAVKGIGPTLARRLVAAFGDRTLEVMEKEPDRLLQVEGIGAKKLESIVQAAQGERSVRDALVFLEGYGISPGMAARIMREYKEETIAKVRANPYCLADDIFGVGFRTADGIAMAMGVERDSPMRAEAALAHALNQATAEGHVYLPKDELVRRAMKMDIPQSACEAALEALTQRGDIVVDDGDERPAYPAFLRFAEIECARRLIALADREVPRDDASSRALEWNEAEGGMALTEEQRRAVALAAEGSGALVVTGGPGTGKTTALRAMVERLERAGRAYALAAPTGRAAKRLQEATGKEAKTLHRLLEYAGGDQGANPRFQRDERSPIPADAIIVDEASMIDLPLFYHLLKAVRPDATLVLVGDADQLPSVGPGNVLRDIIQSRRVPVVRLTTIFRQAQASRIVVNAHRIREGLAPVSGGEASDFFFLAADDPTEALRLIVDLVARRLPKYLQCDPLADVQALATVRRGALGVDSLNSALQEALNPPRPSEASVQLGDVTFRAGDRVMQVKNDYDKNVFNGDIGRIEAIDAEKRTVWVRFPDRERPEPVAYEGQDLSQLSLAYCTSVHKSQGSEYPAVVMPIQWVMPALMNRNLLYTAVTRARRLVVLVGREDALRAYVRNVQAEKRHTGLAERLAK